MEQLNVVGLAGTAVIAPLQYKNVYGRSGIYAIYMDIARDSGVTDRILVLFQEDKVDVSSFGELPWNEQGSRAALIKQDSRIEVTGTLQTYKDFVTGRIQLFVWAYRVTAENEEMANREFNGVYITGEVAKTPVYRKTPLGRRITDVLIMVPSEFKPGFYSFIPCITWGSVAENAQWLKKGDRVYLEGRLQSRDYVKQYDNGAEEITTWEVSVCKLTAEKPEERTEQEGEPEDGN